MNQLRVDDIETGSLFSKNPVFQPYIPDKSGIVYLSGPMTAISYNAAKEWRDDASYILAPLRTLSPLRGKEFLAKLKKIGDYDPTAARTSTDAAIVARDHHDVTVADALLVNLWNAPEISIGTVAEISWAFDRQIPLIAIYDQELWNLDVHNHGFIRRMIPFWVSAQSGNFDQALADACALTKEIILG